jgi:hypothetical protein
MTTTEKAGGASGRRRGWDLFRGGAGILPLPQMPVDGSASQSVENNATQELRIGLLDFFGLGGDIPGESDSDLYGAGLPHGATSLHL